ncbi:MAG: phosphoribosylglycinamide formyltransferase [Balneolaceae bacterium]|nr:MAG: phosphoribosylglycinamide formyltransferase [Balneolaceae bacterium]
MKKLVLFASGSGSNFQAVIDAVKTQKLSAEITGLVASREGIGAIDRAVDHNISYTIIQEPDPQKESEKLNELLNQWDPDLIVLAGYLKKIPAFLINRYRNAIINIHPSLLPKFGGHGYYGLRVHQAVIEAGETQTGCTVHYVTEEYDQGAVIRQEIVPVFENDTPESLAKRVLKAEHKLLPEVIAELIN